MTIALLDSLCNKLCIFWARSPFLFVYICLPGADIWSCTLGCGRVSVIPSTFPVWTVPSSTLHLWRSLMTHLYSTDDFRHPRIGKYLRVFSTVPGNYCTPRKRQSPCYWSRLHLSNTLLSENCLSSVKFFSIPVHILSSLREWNFATYLATQHRQLNTRRPPLPSLLRRCVEEWGTVLSKVLQSAHRVQQWSSSLRFLPWPGRSSKSHPASASQPPSDLPGFSAWLSIVMLLWSSA